MTFLQQKYATKFKVMLSAWLIGLLFIAASATMVQAEARTISLYMINTQQKLTVTYKIDGRYVPAAMKKINEVVRDWRAKESIRMSPKLIDTLWELHRDLGSKREIRVISGYRSPKTNAMLRARSKSVAKKSNHMLGLAMDVRFPDVSVRTLREAGLLKRAGGVGYYPRSNIPFVHIDVGSVRHWPAMKQSELAALFKRGKPFGGFKTISASTSLASKSISKTPKPRVIPKRILVASAPKPVKRPNLSIANTPSFIAAKPLSSPGFPQLRPSISDPELLNEQILLASIFADEEDGDILSLEENFLPDEVISNLSAKSNLSFNPLRDFPNLAIFEVPISIGLTNNQADKLLNQQTNRFIGGFQKIPYPSMDIQPFSKG